jgi:hypothetical protein
LKQDFIDTPLAACRNLSELNAFLSQKRFTEVPIDLFTLRLAGSAAHYYCERYEPPKTMLSLFPTSAVTVVYDYMLTCRRDKERPTADFTTLCQQWNQLVGDLKAGRESLSPFVLKVPVYRAYAEASDKALLLTQLLKINPDSFTEFARPKGPAAARRSSDSDEEDSRCFEAWCKAGEVAPPLRVIAGPTRPAIITNFYSPHPPATHSSARTHVSSVTSTGAEDGSIDTLEDGGSPWGWD